MRTYILAVAAAAGLLAFSVPAAEAGTGGQPPPPGVVSATPASGTPHLPATSSPTQQVRQLVQCGGTMYAVGSFSSIKQGSTTYARTDLVSFSASSPYTVTSWAPVVVGSTKANQDGAAAINSIAFNGGNCADAYIGGNFTKVNGTSVTQHRRDQHQYRQRGDRLRARRQRRGGHPGRGRGPSAGRRHLHLHQRRQHRRAWSA